MMEKLSQMKIKLFKFLPKKSVASAAFQNPTLGPNRSAATRRCRSTPHTVSIIPNDARRKHRSASFSAREPTSPKVSCAGQVQCKKKKKTQKQKGVQQPPKKNGDSVPCHEKKGKIQLWIFKGSGDGPKQSEKAFVLEEKAPATEIAPSTLGTMKKFASGRGSLYDFDVTLAER